MAEQARFNRDWWTEAEALIPEVYRELHTHALGMR
jgi:hypothetical protein